MQEVSRGWRSLKAIEGGNSAGGKQRLEVIERPLRGEQCRR